MKQNKKILNQTENEKKEELEKDTDNKKRPKGSFAKWFWITIISLIVFFTILDIIAVNNLNDIKNSTEVVKKPKPLITEKELEKLKKIAPELFQLIENLPDEYKAKILQSINKNIDKAFEPLYSHIDDFADFHYSVVGEYKELYALLTKNIQQFLIEKIFEPANFDENLNKALENINSDVKNILKEYYNNIKSTIKNRLDINETQTDFIISHIFMLSEEDLIRRLNNKFYNTIKGVGLGGGGVASAIIIKKLVAKNISKSIAKKVLAKIAIKAGTKIAGVTAGAATGAESGLLCGPGAVLCSTVGGIIGGIIGYFATDKIAVEIDKFFNEDSFKAKIRKIIDEEKRKTKLIIYNVYLQSFKQFTKENKEIIKQKIEELKNKPIKDFIK